MTTFYVSVLTKTHFRNPGPAQTLAVKFLGCCPLNYVKLPGKHCQIAQVVLWGFTVPEIPLTSYHQVLFLPSKSLTGTFKINYIQVICSTNKPGFSGLGSEKQ